MTAYFVKNYFTLFADKQLYVRKNCSRAKNAGITSCAVLLKSCKTVKLKSCYKILKNHCTIGRDKVATENNSTFLGSVNVCLHFKYCCRLSDICTANFKYSFVNAIFLWNKSLSLLWKLHTKWLHSFVIFLNASTINKYVNVIGHHEYQSGCLVTWSEYNSFSSQQQEW